MSVVDPIPYVVRPRGNGYVVVKRESGDVVTAVLSQAEAHHEVWELNGRRGSWVPPKVRQEQGSEGV